VDHAPDYAFPHTAEDQRLGIAEGARCLEVGAGRGSIAAWLCRAVGPAGHVTATDLQTSMRWPQHH
jgi:tRNA A58 N-methylase Trm61